MKIKTITINTVLILSAMSASHGESPLPTDDIQEHFEVTQNLLTQAKKENRLWRDTQNILSDAESLITTKKYNEAEKLIKQAEFQIQQAQEQASSQHNIHMLLPIYLKP